MPRTGPSIIVALIIVGVIAMMMCAFQVGFTETVVVTRFDEIRQTIGAENPGFHWKWPWPIDRVHRYDARLRTLETEFKQLGTRDQRTLVVTAYATWQIADAATFLRTVGREDQASRTIQDLLEDRVSTVMRLHDMEELVNLDKSKMQFGKIEAEFLEGIQKPAADKYGIRIQSVGIKRLAIPEAVTREVFARMKEDRQKTIKELTAAGSAEAKRIEANAKAVANKIVERANAYAVKVEAEGEKEKQKYLKYFAANPQLSDFLKKCETLLKVMRAGQMTLVLDAAKVIPFDLLRDAAIEKSAVKPGDEKPDAGKPASDKGSKSDGDKSDATKLAGKVDSQ